MLKKLFSNPSLLFLLAGNFYCIWYFQQNPDDFATIVWIYWFQSIIIGLLNFLYLLFIENYDATTMKVNNKPVSSMNKGCLAWFFLVHYGIFHLVYAVFLLVDFGISSINKKLFLIGIAAFTVEAILNIIRQKQLEKTALVNIGALFFLPYLRIFPMHLMILLPVFFGWEPSLLFLVLKMAADILSFYVYQHLFSKAKFVQIKT